MVVESSNGLSNHHSPHSDIFFVFESKLYIIYISCFEVSFSPPASSPTSAYFFMPQEPRQQQCRIMHATLLLKGEK